MMDDKALENKAIALGRMLYGDDYNNYNLVPPRLFIHETIRAALREVAEEARRASTAEAAALVRSLVATGKPNVVMMGETIAAQIERLGERP